MRMLSSNKSRQESIKKFFTPLAKKKKEDEEERRPETCLEKKDTKREEPQCDDNKAPVIPNLAMVWAKYSSYPPWPAILCKG